MKQRFYLIFCLTFVWLCFCSSFESDVFKVKRGKFKATVTETGELLAVSSRVITIPNYDHHLGKAKLIDIAKEGLKVKKGQVVAQLDTTAQLRELAEKEAELELQIKLIQTYFKLLDESDLLPAVICFAPH